MGKRLFFGKINWKRKLFYLLALVSFDAGLRVFFGTASWSDIIDYKTNDGRCFGLKKNFHTVYNGGGFKVEPTILDVNGGGYRGVFRSERKTSKATKRVAFIGDSFTYGLGVNQDDSFVSKMERELTLRNLDVELLNFGMLGTNLEGHLDEYKYHVAKWENDLVVILLYDNDLGLNQVCDPFLKDKADNRYFLKTLTSYSYTLRLFLTKYRNYYVSSRGNFPLGTQIERIKKQFSALKEFTKTRPERIVFGLLGKGLEKNLGLSMDKYFNEYNLDYFRVPFDFGDQNMLIKNDWHLNAEGHKVMAKMLIPVIEERLFPSQDQGRKGN